MFREGFNTTDYNKTKVSDWPILFYDRNRVYNDLLLQPLIGPEGTLVQSCDPVSSLWLASRSPWMGALPFSICTLYLVDSCPSSQSISHASCKYFPASSWIYSYCPQVKHPRGPVEFRPATSCICMIDIYGGNWPLDFARRNIRSCPLVRSTKYNTYHVQATTLRLINQSPSDHLSAYSSNTLTTIFPNQHIVKEAED